MPTFSKVYDIDSGRLATLALPATTDNARGVLANLVDYWARNAFDQLARNTFEQLARNAAVPAERALRGLALHIAWNVYPSTAASEVLAPDLFDDGSTHAEWFVVVTHEATQFFTNREVAKVYLLSDATGKPTRMYRWATPESWGLDRAREEWVHADPAGLGVLYDDTLAPRSLDRAPQYRSLLNFNLNRRGMDPDVARILVTADALAAFATTELTEAFDEVADLIEAGGYGEDYVSVGGVLLRLIGRFEEYLAGEREAEVSDFELAPREGDPCYLIATRVADGDTSQARVVRTKGEAVAVLGTPERASIVAVLAGRVTADAASWQDVRAEAAGEAPLYLNHLDG